MNVLPNAQSVLESAVPSSVPDTPDAPETPNAPDTLEAADRNQVSTVLGSASPEAAAAPPSLSADHIAQIAVARLTYRPIARALRVVTFSAVTLAVFAAFSWLMILPFVSFSFKGLFVALGLSGCAVYEFRGRNALRSLAPTAPRNLAINQGVLTVFLIVYCVWSMGEAWFGPDPYAQVIANNPDVGELLAPYGDLFRQITVGFYAVVLLVGLIVQAMVIAYYATRRRPLKTYLAQTPAWVIELTAFKSG